MKKFSFQMGSVQQLVLVIFFVIMIAMLIVPLPTLLIDALIGLNLALAVTIVVTSLFMVKILDFSTLPTIILLTTMFRLALGVATTRLILANGEAGHIITAFGNFVVSGNVVVGLVIFFIIAIVQFMVVTKGSERIAEVIARFSLDAMPGKQMAIDADVRSGISTVDEARARRAILEQESQFFGSMDGAMRFVKGDAIAGLIIVFVNLLGGLLIGIFKRDMSAAEAFYSYSLLSVGEGLVAQIPSILIALSAGMVVTRVTKEDAGNIGGEIAAQLAKQPYALGCAGIFSIMLAFIPGFPSGVLASIGVALAIATFVILRKNGTKIPFIKTSDPQRIENPETATDAKRNFIDPISAPSLLLTGTSGLRDALVQSNVAYFLNEAFVAEVARLGVPIMLPGYKVEENDDGLSYFIEGEKRLQLKSELMGSAMSIVDIIVRETRLNVYRTFDSEMATFWKKQLKERFSNMVTNVERNTPTVFMAEVVRRLLMHNISLRQPRVFLEALLRADEFGKDPAKVCDYVRIGQAQLTKADLRDRGAQSEQLIILEDLAPVDLAPFSATDISQINLRKCETSLIGARLLELRNMINGHDQVLVVAERSIQFALQYALHTWAIKAWVRLVDEIPNDINATVLELITSRPLSLEKDGLMFQNDVANVEVVAGVPKRAFN